LGFFIPHLFIVKQLEYSLLQKSQDVIPAEAGIQFFDAFWTPALALWGVDPYPPACKPYGLEAGTESGVTGVVRFART